MLSLHSACMSLGNSSSACGMDWDGWEMVKAGRIFWSLKSGLDIKRMKWWICCTYLYSTYLYFLHRWILFDTFLFLLSAVTERKNIKPLVRYSIDCWGLNPLDNILDAVRYDFGILSQLFDRRTYVLGKIFLVFFKSIEMCRKPRSRDGTSDFLVICTVHMSRCIAWHTSVGGVVDSFDIFTHWLFGAFYALIIICESVGSWRNW